MKKCIVIIGILTLAACSNHQNNLAGVDSAGEKQAQASVSENNNKERLDCKRAQKSTKSPFEVKECTEDAQIEAREDNEKENLADRKLQETRKIGRVLDKSH